MNKIYDIINERTGGKYRNVRFGEVVLDKISASVTVICAESDYSAVSSDTELSRLINEICAFNAPLRVNIKAENLSAREITEVARAFTRRFPFVASIADKLTAIDSPPSVKLSMHESMKKLAENDYIPRLQEYLNNRFVTPISVETVTVEQESIDSNEDREPTVYEISVAQPVFGQNTGATKALSSGDVEGNRDDITVCGVLAMPTAYMSKGSGVKRSRPYEKFLLYDGDKTLQCRCFPSDGSTVKSAELIGKSVCAFGNSEVERGRTGETSMTVRSLAEVVSGGAVPVKAVPEPEKYTVIVPRPYEEYVQASIFSDDGELPDSLKGTFVAFDFETTGLSIAYDKPTELGAVKICDGVITEVFTTLIDPRRPIPEEVSAKTGITDAMVKGKPLFEDIIPDFYKFTYGCSLIGHNIAFDFPFLLKYGNRTGFSFGDRRTFDTLGMAPRAIPGIDVLTLDRVLESLGLVNDNAHRALSDATATAKAFIAMNKMIAGT